MLVKDEMTSSPWVIPEREPIEQIAELLRRHHIHQVPVVDQANRLVGIVTDRDLRSALGFEGANRHKLGLLAEDIMSTDVVTVTPDQDVADALDILCEKHYGALPVVEGDHVVGIISTRDLLWRLRGMIDADAIPEVKPTFRTPTEMFLG